MADQTIATEPTMSIRERNTRLDALSRRIRELEAKVETPETDEWIKSITNITGLKARQEALNHALVAWNDDSAAGWDALCDAIDLECGQLMEPVAGNRTVARAPARPAPQAATLEGRFAAAMRDPREVFSSADDVVADAGFSIRQKVAVLKRWEADARDLAVAEEENMTGGEPNRLREVLLAIQKLEPSDPDAKTAPTKQGG